MQPSIGAALAAIVIGFLASCSDSEKSGQADQAVAPDSPSFRETLSSVNACRQLVMDGLRDVPDDRSRRFTGKVQEETAECRGGKRALAAVRHDTPWVDWSTYWATGDAGSRNDNYDDGWSRFFGGGLTGIHLHPNMRGIDGALIDLEYQRLELIKFNLFDNYTYDSYIQGRGSRPGRTLDVWDEMRLPDDHPAYEQVGGDGDRQVCNGELIRHRTLTGICNDVFNPMMGSTNTLFARNVEFSETFPDEGHTDLTRNRHADRIDLMTPDPQVVSRKLFTRVQSRDDLCNQGLGLENESPGAHCDYHKAPFFNVLAAFWIQFMTHDWFSHLDEGENGPAPAVSAGCRDAAATGCRENDRFRRTRVAQSEPAPTFQHGNASHLGRAHRTFENSVTAWWDASQIYGYDERSRSRVKRDPDDPARLTMVAPDRESRPGDQQGYLPRFAPRCEASASDDCDDIHPAWSGQEATAFPDNWTVGLSFLHNVFAREHNLFVDAFRARVEQAPDEDSGLRDPSDPNRVISYSQVSDDELFEIARLVVAAEIAKIHTIEWTTQLLYDEPLYRGMNANWNGLFGERSELVSDALSQVVRKLRESDEEDRTNTWYSVLAAGPGIVGLGSRREGWNLHNAEHINGGVNHFGSPFNFPEEFITVYRLHPLVPDLLELRRLDTPNTIARKVPAVKGFRAGASDLLQRDGLAEWALSMGRQRLGLLTLQNHAQFLQNLPLPTRDSPSGKLDIAALDIIRDRERGVPRFNEFRRQYGLEQLTSFDDFVDHQLPASSAERRRQEHIAATLREVYGQHRCDASKVISHAQRDEHDDYPNDCLGHPDGTMVDNVEDVDTVVGWLAEPIRPHGFAISETQFVVFILNASRRLFSDRFFTSSFRPEFYSDLGYEWVQNNGPAPQMERGAPNGHEQPVSPMKRVLQRTIPVLADDLDGVINAFDPWARDRGSYYSLQWKPRADAAEDASFAN